MGLQGWGKALGWRGPLGCVGEGRFSGMLLRMHAVNSCRCVITEACACTFVHMGVSRAL